MNLLQCNTAWLRFPVCFDPRWMLLGVGLLMYSNAGYATEDGPRFVTRSWSVEQGLPHNVVNRVVQDGRGFLWIATGAGLVRFDGIAFEEIRLPGRGVASPTNIRDLRALSDGSLLVLAATGEIFVWKNGEFALHPASPAMAGRTLLEVYAEPNGALWLGTFTGEVVRWENGKTEVFGQAEGILRRVNRTTFVTDGQGVTWVASGDFVGRYAHGRLTPLSALAATVGRAMVIARASSGGVWVSTADQLLKIEGDQVTPCVQNDWPAKRSGIEVLFEDHRGNLWVGTRRNGLYLYSVGRLTHVDFEPRTVFSLHEDGDGNIWAGTSAAGLCRLRPLTFTLLNRESGLFEEISSSVAEDSTGAIWCANRSGGLVKWKDGVVQHVAENVRAARYPTRVAPDQKGNLWVASGGHILRLPLDQPQAVEQMKEEFKSVQVLFGTRAGEMLVASASGLGGFRDGVYQPMKGADGPFTAHVNAVAEDEHGGIWIGTTDARAFESESRLWQSTGGNVVERVPANKWPAGAIHGMQFDPLGGLWIASSAGLVLKEGERLTRFTTEEGLPDDVLMEVLVDDLGFIWCGGRRGFFRVASSDLRAVADGRLRKIVPTVLGLDDGLRGASTLSGGHPTAWKAHDGKLWFTTIRGVVGFDPAAVGTSTTSPPVFINAVDLDEQRLSPSASDRVEVPSGSHRVSFHFSALNYSAPEQAHLRHRLEGFDDDWVETGQERMASYARLPPGHYRLRVIAANQNGVWNEQGATLAVVVAAAWWQTRWFGALAIIVLAGSIAWGVRTLSLRKISRRLETLEKENALERERSRIARNLHDELGGSLTQIGLLADRLKRQSTEGDVQRVLGQLAWRTRSLAGDLESIVWTVSPQNNSWDRLAAFIAQFARRFFRDTQIGCVVSGVEMIPLRPLSPDAQHEVLAVLKESLNNVLKHSHATQIAIEMKLLGDVFELSVKDNGVGFTPGLAEHSERNGLNNIRARGAILRGETLVQSRPGEGTKVILRVPA